MAMLCAAPSVLTQTHPCLYCKGLNYIVGGLWVYDIHHYLMLIYILQPWIFQVLFGSK